ncbi:outer membrane protein assembly factor BamB family protein [Actinoplanes sp. RD1]|uniref:outer membrane protein assembly factor BamB family protein n=1 Tax=Actinoplanes sp. RD1 TaxID=3064538 RepID=UPI002740D0C3|nr:PQQ-binding-like beta-propeller repeat protein [Actinoplanes sp. RD1]
MLITLGGAAPPGRPLVQVLSIGGTATAGFSLAPGALFAAELGAGASAGIRRYDVESGRVVWSVTVPHVVKHLWYDESSGLLLARAGDTARTTVLDGADGRQLWHLGDAESSILMLAGGQVLLRGDRTGLRLVDGRTGGLIWRVPIAARADVHYDDGAPGPPQRITVVGLDGHVLTLRYADGARLGEGELGVPLSAETEPGSGADYAGASIVGDRLYLSREERGQGVLTAFRLPGLTVIWRRSGVPSGYLGDCGAVVCVTDSTGVTALDPADGSVRWSHPGWIGAVAFPGGRLMGYEGTPEQAAEVDATTGEVLRRIGPTQWADGVELREDRTTAERVWIRRDVRGAGVAGAITTAGAYACDVEPPYLACPTIFGATGVWRLPAT